MTLKDIASIAGKPGLFKIQKTTRSGLIVEAIGGSKKKFVVNANHRISVLQEISIYSTGEEESVGLAEIFENIKEKHAGEALTVDTKDQDALLEFLGEVLPTFDRSRVYASDVKKMVNWYNILLEYYPEVLEPEEPENGEDEPAEESKSEDSAQKAEDTTDDKPKKE